VLAGQQIRHGVALQYLTQHSGSRRIQRASDRLGALRIFQGLIEMLLGS
jgi:hypothetical protein